MLDASPLLALSSHPDGVMLYDRSHWGRIRLTGADRVRFLHNQTSNKLQGRQSGECCDTTFITSTARTIDLATAILDDAELIAIVSPERRAELLPLLDRYIFPMDRVTLADITDDTLCFSAIGAGSEALCNRLGLSFPTAGTHQRAELTIGDRRLAVHLVGSSSLSQPGLTLLASATERNLLWSHLVSAGATPIDHQAWEALRVLDGRPYPDRELTLDYNPLEAGLWHTVSFDKGCYIGQETIARLNTYQGVKQQLWGLCSETAFQAGEGLMLEDVKVGVVTSAIATTSGTIGLGYIRTKAGGAGLTVMAGDATVRAIDIPHATRGYLAAGLPV
jgi:tRNA-modifying protein YgfZ